MNLKNINYSEKGRAGEKKGRRKKRKETIEEEVIPPLQ